MRKQRLTCLRFTCQKSQSSWITEPCPRAADHHLLRLSSQEDPTRLRICTGFSVPPALPGPGSMGDTATLCHPRWHTMKSGGPHSSCSTLPNLSEHISCAHKPAHQLSAPIKECEMWLIQSLQRGDQGKWCAGRAAAGPLSGPGHAVFLALFPYPQMAIVVSSPSLSFLAESLEFQNCALPCLSFYQQTVLS